jgi:ADP-ribose pyrophosphatase
MDSGKLLERRPIFDGRIVKLSVDTVRLPNGNVAELEMIRHQGAAAAVPVDADRNVLMVRQYRHAAGGWLLEVPAGKLDPGEPPEVCALREVEEETGFRPEKLIPMGWIFTTPGFTDEKIWLYAATDLQAARQELEVDEVLTVETMPLDRAVALAAGGEIRDAKSVCALMRVSHFIHGGAQIVPPRRPTA